MSQYANIYRQFFATIGRPLTENDELPPSSWSKHPIAVPAAITDFFSVAGRAYDFTQAYNRLLSPDKWIVGTDVCVVLEENQGVLLWGYRVEDQHLDNPIAYQAVYDETLVWESLELPFSEFLLVTISFQQAFGDEVMPFEATALLTEALAEKIERTWTKVGQIYGWHAFIRPNCLLCHLDYEDESRIFIGAQSAEIIEQVGTELGVEWDDGMAW